MEAADNSKQQELDEQKRQLLNYILAKMFTNEDIVDQLQQISEPKIEKSESIPTSPPRFKALMEKISKVEGESDVNSRPE